MRRTYQLCKKGLHRLDPANTYEHPSKGPECRECKRDYMRDYMRELRAKMRECVFRQHHVLRSLVQRRLHRGEILHALALQHIAALAQRGHGKFGVVRRVVDDQQA